MSDLNCPVKNPLQRDGTSQDQRMIEALDPGYAKVHEFTMRDWMRFAYSFSDKIKYYSINSFTEPQGNWSDFFINDEQLNAFIKEASQPSQQNIEPHLALFVSFIKLLTESQGYLNNFTKRHLDFYYQKVLQIKKLPATPDKVYIIFELAKNVTSYKLGKDTLLDAGKDASGKPLVYKVKGEPVFNQAKAALFKNVRHKRLSDSSEGKNLRYAEVANSADGLGAKLNKDYPLWDAFGFKGLPNANIGFSVSSPILFLKEGVRVINLIIELTGISGVTNYNGFSVQFTSEKGWINGIAAQLTEIPEAFKDQNIDLKSTFAVKVTIDKSQKAIVAYNPKIHQGNYSTHLPVLRCLFDTSSSAGYENFLRFSSANIKSIKIQVAVSDIQSFEAENDLGKLDVTKPFLPFGPIPRIGSNFKIRCPEIFIKNCNKIGWTYQWNNLPNDLAAYYSAYLAEYINKSMSVNKYKHGMSDLLANLRATQPQNIKSESKVEFDNSQVVSGNGYFTTEISVISERQELTSKSDALFSPGNQDDYSKVNKTITLNGELGGNGIGDFPVIENEYDQLFIKSYLSGHSERPLYKLSFNPGFEEWDEVSILNRTKDSYINISLEKDFLHQYYPLLYSIAISIGEDAELPKEPYTPMLASLLLNYSASISENISDDTSAHLLENFRKRDIQFFYNNIFGEAQQHYFLLKLKDFISQGTKINLLPEYPSEGEFYIGLTGVEPESMVSMLFQVAEGSEDPNSGTFNDDENIIWSALCNNYWRPLNKDYIVEDSTNNFLRPGIIKFLMPKDINNDNTIMPSGYFWLRAQLPNQVAGTSVCRFVEVLTQATESEFMDKGNDLSHLSAALPSGSISKVINRPSEIKTITQPYSSFGGRGIEDDKHYYIRISERLRHKNRAISIWDYEHLILEKFPPIYKVKCLNHSNSNEEICPGSIRIIPIPDLRNRNFYNRFKPCVSKNVLSEIEQYLCDINSYHVDCKASNPVFDEITFSFKVKFYKQYDPNAYIKILKSELDMFLSPWVSGNNSNIQFGGVLYKSQVISYIENIEYVDYITDFKMFQNKIFVENKIEASESGAIITTGQEHQISSI